MENGTGNISNIFYSNDNSRHRSNNRIDSRNYLFDKWNDFKVEEKKMKNNIKIILIIASIIIGVIVLISCIFIGTNNTAINLEEQIKESKSSINIQEKRREDLIYNLVDTVESYNQYEQETMTKIVDARSKASNGDVEEAEILINAVAEQYPELKSNENYKSLMTELAVTENLIAEHRNNYNIQVKQYNKHIKKFPNNMILNIMGYEKLDDTYLNYEASEDAPRDLFEE